MAKETTSVEDAQAKGGSLNNDAYGIGQLADGSFNIFPADELAERIAARDSQEQADDFAFEQSENGFKDPFLDDVGDDDDDDEDIGSSSDEDD
jgi:hypothetical protein